MGGERAAVCRMGDLSHEWIAGRPEPALRLAIEWVVRASDPAVRRRWENLEPAGNQTRRPHGSGWDAEGTEQHVSVRHVRSHREAADDASVVRRHATAVGVQTGVASRTIIDRSRCGL